MDRGLRWLACDSNHDSPAVRRDRAAARASGDPRAGVAAGAGRPGGRADRAPPDPGAAPDGGRARAGRGGCPARAGGRRGGAVPGRAGRGGHVPARQPGGLPGRARGRAGPGPPRRRPPGAAPRPPHPPVPPARDHRPGPAGRPDRGCRRLAGFRRVPSARALLREDDGLAAGHRDRRVHAIREPFTEAASALSCSTGRGVLLGLRTRDHGRCYSGVEVGGKPEGQTLLEGLSREGEEAGIEPST